MATVTYTPEPTEAQERAEITPGTHRINIEDGWTVEQTLVAVLDGLKLMWVDEPWQAEPRELPEGCEWGIGYGDEILDYDDVLEADQDYELVKV